MDKRIEEMAHCICTRKNPCKECTEYDFGRCKFIAWCEILHNKNYRTIPEIVLQENCFVLSQSQYDLIVQKARKKTAEEFAERVKGGIDQTACVPLSYRQGLFEIIDIVCKVITEGKKEISTEYLLEKGKERNKVFLARKLLYGRKTGDKTSGRETPEENSNIANSGDKGGRNDDT